MASRAKKMKMVHPSGTNRVEKPKCLVEKERLVKAIELHNKGTSSVDFAWGMQIQADDIDFSAFEVKELGEIKIPVSLKVYNSPF